MVWERRRIGLAVMKLPASEEPDDGGVNVELIAFPATRYHNVSAPEEANQDRAWNLEEGIAVGRAESQGDKVAAGCGPGPDTDIADAGWLIESGHEQFTGERPADGFPTGGLCVEQNMDRVWVGWVVAQARADRTAVASGDTSRREVSTSTVAGRFSPISDSFQSTQKLFCQEYLTFK